MAVVQRCARCGTARRGDLQVCVRCETPFADSTTDLDSDVQRPAAPSVVQTHGTMAAVVVLGIIMMGVLFALSVRKVGPFTGEITGQRPAGSKITVTVHVANAGARAGRGNCRVKVSTSGGRITNVSSFLTQRIPGKSSITAEVDVPTTDGTPVSVSCA